MAVSIIVLELRGDLLAWVRAGRWADPGEAPCLLGLVTLLWSGRVDSTEDSLIIQGIISGVCHCRSATRASDNVDLNQAIVELHGVIVDNGEDLGGYVDRGAEYLGSRTVQGCRS